jgi:hypothetical protein
MASTKKAPEKLSRARPKLARKVAILIDPPARWTPVGGSQKRSVGGSRGVKAVRNPWTPDDIVILLKFVVTYQAGKYLIELIKLWMEYRKAQKIEIKVGDNELKIEGHVSDKALEKKIKRFRELIKGATYDDIEVALPKGARRNIPAKLADKKAKRGGDK